MKIRLAVLALIAAGIAAGTLYAIPDPQGTSPQTVRVGGTIKPPQKVRGEPPVYPAIAKAGHTEGVVILEATIGTDGKVKDVKVLRSVKLLEDAAVNAVRSWEYKPTVVNGQAVQVIMTIPVNFTLE